MIHSKIAKPLALITRGFTMGTTGRIAPDTLILQIYDVAND